MLEEKKIQFTMSQNLACKPVAVSFWTGNAIGQAQQSARVPDTC